MSFLSRLWNLLYRRVIWLAETKINKTSTTCNKNPIKNDLFRNWSTLNYIIPAASRIRTVTDSTFDNLLSSKWLYIHPVSFWISATSSGCNITADLFPMIDDCSALVLGLCIISAIRNVSLSNYKEEEVAWVEESKQIV